MFRRSDHDMDYFWIPQSDWTYSSTFTVNSSMLANTEVRHHLLCVEFALAQFTRHRCVSHRFDVLLVLAELSRMLTMAVVGLVGL